jgi:NAD(P)-dependent dehydrogenase (short-subunit alcohol dehydrogenase family)
VLGEWGNLEAGVRICVVDGQGGGIGSAIVKRLRESLGNGAEIIALGTNAIATAAMLKAGANKGATGENAVVRTVARADVVVGSIGIIMAHAMMGELTPAMAEAVAACPALKILIPMTQERLQVVGVSTQPLPHMIEEMVAILRREVTG